MGRSNETSGVRRKHDTNRMRGGNGPKNVVKRWNISGNNDRHNSKGVNMRNLEGRRVDNNKIGLGWRGEDTSCQELEDLILMSISWIISKLNGATINKLWRHLANYVGEVTLTNSWKIEWEAIIGFEWVLLKVRLN